eukprot:CAMPEP_0170212184 /NCGR_PEP_ID=MMETSP0116_2-20130129/5709_1 /TAXON_ID=400756 /ORGANISM="Durinskia baltica, Strain CSIRO CS-38" /LENGTH=344 /DNA_ID=CAMNT_0010462721 /DNA_START=19 /DNA_END=1053 /DNA_ORIENTATION=+
MTTIQRPRPAGDSAWDMMRHIAGAACQSAGAYLSGTYTYTFSNSATRTVKLHLTDDRAYDAPQTDKAPQAYFLTVPPDSRGVEVPMVSGRIRVTAGFFHADLGRYEIFWESRPFTWEAGVKVSVGTRHSVDLNVFRDDVLPLSSISEETRNSSGLGEEHMARRGARVDAVEQPIARRDRTSGRAALRLSPAEPAAKAAIANGNADDATDSTLSGLVIYTHGASGWVSGTVARELEDGTLEVESGSNRWTLQPQEQVALLPLPAPVRARTIADTTPSFEPAGSWSTTAVPSATSLQGSSKASSASSRSGAYSASSSAGFPTMATDVTVVIRNASSSDTDVSERRH